MYKQDMLSGAQKDVQSRKSTVISKSKIGTRKKKNEPSAREKAIQFAKNVPKPKMKPKPDTDTDKIPKSPRLAGSPLKEEYDKLEARHEMYFDEVARMRK